MEAIVAIILLILYLALFAVWVTGWIVSIMGLIDNGKHEEPAYIAAGTTKQTAMILCIVGLVACFPVGLYYWFGIRKKVLAAEAGGAGGAPGYSGYAQ